MIFVSAFIGGMITTLMDSLAGWGVGGAVGGITIGMFGPPHRRIERMIVGAGIGCLLGFMQEGFFFQALMSLPTIVVLPLPVQIS
jgi:hypothetical protein